MSVESDAAYLVDGRYGIEDLVDVAALRRLFEKFSAATGFTTGFLSYPAQKVLIATGWRDACVKYHRAVPGSAAHCRESNVELSRRLREHKELSVRRCGMGLVDGATPVIVRGAYIAYLATGQVFFETPDLERYRRFAAEYGYEPEAYLAAIRAVPVVTEGRFRDALSYLSEIAVVVAELGLANLEGRERARQLEREVEERRQVQAALAAEHARLEVASATGRRQAQRLDRINAVLLSLGADGERNIQTLGELCGELLEADTALYSRVEQGLLCVRAAWHAPAELKREDQPDGHLCNDVIRAPGEAPLVVRNLPASSYARTDPNVAAFGLHTYVGYPVRSAERTYGSLCVVYTRDVEPGPDDLHTLGIVATAIRQEEERARAEEALRVRNRAIEASTAAIAMSDLGGRLTYVNASFLRVWGYDREDEVLGRHATEFWEGTGAAAQVLAEVGARGGWVGELQGRRRGGEVFDVQVSTSLVRDGRGQPLCFLAWFLDVTERRRAEAERQRLERQVQQARRLESMGLLAGGVAHDFNNLLTSVMGSLELALLDLEPAAPARDELRAAVQGVHRATELVRQLLAYSGRGRLETRRLDVRQLVRETTHLVRRSIGPRVDLRFAFPEQLPAVEADATQVRQVVLNLVINAAEALGDREGTITVGAGVMACDRAYLTDEWLSDPPPPGDYVYFEVVDTGCGILPENMPHLFDPFFTTKFTGRGLGLAAVLGIVRAHGGAIKVATEPGRGSTFRVLFPAAEGPAEPQGPPAPDLGGDWRGAGLVLLVDDEESVRATGRRMLERLGFRVVVAGNGLEAVERFRAHQAELAAVLLDVTMPRMDGAAVCRELRRLGPGVPVVLASGYNEQDVAARCAGAGAAGFIQKPFTLAALRETLRRVCGGPAPASAG